jgi:tetratricopeptide (TPR) repeat protein
MRRIVVALALSAVAASAQPKDQASAAQFALTDTINQSRQLSARGDHVGALKLMEGVFAKVQSDPAFKDRYAEVGRALGQSYTWAKRYPDAVRTFKAVVESTKTKCVPGNPMADICADTLYDLATAQMYTEDWAGAAASLRKGIPLYEAVIKAGVGGEYKMAKLKLEANTQSMLAAALFRAGDVTGAIATWDKAIQQYQTVVKNPASSNELRELARQSLAQEQRSLNMVKQEAKSRGAQKETPKK